MEVVGEGKAIAEGADAAVAEGADAAVAEGADVAVLGVDDGVGLKRRRLTKAEWKEAKRGGAQRKHEVKVRLGRRTVDVAPLARAQYGVLFDCDSKGRFEPLRRGEGRARCTCGGRGGVKTGEGSETGEGAAAEASTSVQGAAAREDNRNLVQNMSNQALTADEIVALKKERGGAAAVAALAASSSTFESKTVFSQIKYLKKKAERHVQRCVVHKFCAWRAAARHWDTRGKWDPLGSPRLETLAYALTAAGVAPGARVVCVELRPGPLGVAVRERLAGTGDVCHVHCAGPSAVHVVGRPSVVTPEFRPGGPNTGYAPISDLLRNHVPAEVSHKVAPGIGPRPAPIQEWAREGRATALVAQLPGGVNSASLLSALLGTLLPGHAFSIYAVDPAQLAKAAVHVRATGEAKLVQLTEGFMHPYQVLPKRTHPVMTGSSTGGYLLSGFKTVL